MSMSAMAQKKVAILETVDRSGEISYAIKMMLRNSLTIAISNTPGYEGYDRVDMASISQEQDFQRTGLVSDDQIKQLGVATGAAYVLVAEAAKYDAENIIITAKILNVETFGVENVAMQVTGTSADQMKKSCATLAKKLLKPATSNSQIEPASTTRTTWIGIALEGGIFNDSKDLKIEQWPVLGVALDMSFAFSKSFSLGPYFNINSYFDDSHFYLGALGGLMAKYTFKNDAALLFGGGGGFTLLGEEALFLARIGIKFPNLMYLTGSFYCDDAAYDIGILFGLGFSFGGEKK